MVEFLDYKKGGEFNFQKWRQVKVGDVILVRKDTEFPADLLLISAPKEIVYVDTMNLDGETNLKEKYPF
jgi:phospholipid-translocating ATPase